MSSIESKELYPIGVVAKPHKRDNPKGLGLLPYSYRKVMKLCDTAFKEVVVIEKSSHLRGSRYFLYGRDLIAFKNKRIKNVG